MIAMEAISPVLSAMATTMDTAYTRTPSAAARVKRNNPAVNDRSFLPKAALDQFISGVELSAKNSVAAKQS